LDAEDPTPERFYPLRRPVERRRVKTSEHTPEYSKLLAGSESALVPCGDLSNSIPRPCFPLRLGRPAGHHHVKTPRRGQRCGQPVYEGGQACRKGSADPKAAVRNRRRQPVACRRAKAPGLSWDPGGSRPAEGKCQDHWDPTPAGCHLWRPPHACCPRSKRLDAPQQWGPENGPSRPGFHEFPYPIL